MNKNISIVIPVYNDWLSLTPLVQRIGHVFSSNDYTGELYIIDDHSSLKSSKFVQECMNIQEQCTSLSRIIQIVLCRNMGHQGAIAIALPYIVTHSDCECVVIMDADGEDKPEDIPHLISAMERAGNDSIIFAKRRRRQENMVFRAMYSLFKFLHFLLTGKQMDIGNFSIVPLPCVDALLSYHELWSHYPATVLKSNLPMIKIPCDKGLRIDGRSKMSITSLILHGFGSLSVFAPIIGIRMLIMATILMCLLCAGIICIFAIRLLTYVDLPGWATYTTGLSAILLLQLLSMSLFFIFLILNGRNPSQHLPKHTFHLFIQDVQILWKTHEDA